MYCPNCGGASTAGLRFCKACGTNLEMVSHALGGQLVPPAQAPAPAFDIAQYSNLNMAAYKGMGIGLAFLLAAMAFLFMSRGDGIWVAFGFFIAAATLFSKGFAQFMTVKKLEQLAAPRMPQVPYAPPPPLPPHISTQPPSPGSSVTEQTTRHLGSVSKE